MTKVFVIGAGPSGLSCAEVLASSSLDVTMIEQKRRVGENPHCAGGLSSFMVEKVGFDVPESSIVARVRRVRIYAPNLKYWEFKSDDGYGYVLDRELFERNMANRVERLGGRIGLGSSVSAVDMNNFQMKYDYIVGADGPASTVRQWLGLPKYSLDDVHIGVQKTISMDSYPQDTMELYFGEKIAPQGYAWIFPGGNGMVRIGLGVPSSKGWLAMDRLDNFIHRHVYSVKATHMFGKQIPTARMPRTGVYGRILLVGDALPSTDPFTGGGISQGIATGKAAGRALAEGSPSNYDRYVDWLRKQNNRRYKLKKVLYSFSDHDFNDLVEVMQGFEPRPILSVGNELRRAIVRLVWKKPRLLRKFFKMFPTTPT